MTITLGSLCSGYEGLGMAISQVLDVELAWVADPDKGATAVLAHHHPHVPNLGDITTVDWTTVPRVDVLAAGFPCQSVSVAGRRAGLVADAASGLWSHVAIAIDAVRPPLVVIENVGGLRSARADSDVEPCPWCLGDPGDEPHLRALGAVLGDLAAVGFHAEWTSLRASDVGAPHARERVIILAWPAADAAHFGHERRRFAWGRRPGLADGGVASAHADRGGQRSDEPDLRPGQSNTARCFAANADGGGRGLEPRFLSGERAEERVSTDIAWGDYEPAIRRWERILGRAAPHPTEPGAGGKPRLSPVFVEWLMGLPGGHVTAVPGLTRNQMLKLLGNGVVWQQGAAALAHLLDRIGMPAADGAETPAA